MLIVDDILLSPMRGFLWIFREIQNAACQELSSEPEDIARQLRLLYMRLETRQITEPEFQEQETRLLDRLEEIQGSNAAEEEIAGGR